MKLIRVFNLLVLTSLTTSALQTQTTTIPEFAKLLETWDDGDVQQFLKDRNIKYDVATPTEKTSIENLKLLAADEIAKLYEASNRYENLFYDQAHSVRDNLYDMKETVLSYVWPKHISERVSKSYSYLLDQWNSNDHISDWIFDTWSLDQLKHTLEKNKIKYKANSTKKDLVKLAKSNYAKISKNSNASGKYPGDWLFEAWSIDDLTNWLHQNNVATTKKLSKDRDYLLKQVRENIYPASVYARETRDELFESLNIPSQDDHSSGFKDGIVDSWTESQLYTWLQSHGVQVEDNLKQNKLELTKLVKENKSSLQDDINEWIEYTKSKKDNLLEKVPSKEDLLEKVPSKDNLINDTFFVDVDKWPKDRLKAFLTSRGIKIPLFATRKDLVKLVQKHKSRNLVDFNKITPEVLFTGWSTEKIKEWLQANKIDASGLRDVVVKRGSDLYKHLQKENFYKEHLITLANVAKDTAVDYSLKGKKMADQVYEDYKDPVGDALNTAKEKAVDAAELTRQYGSDFYDYLLSWSTDDLQKYLKSFGVSHTNEMNRDDLISRAKKNTMSFFNGSDGWLVKKKSKWSLGYWKDLYLSMRGY